VSETALRCEVCGRSLVECHQLVIGSTAQGSRDSLGNDAVPAVCVGGALSIASKSQTEKGGGGPSAVAGRSLRRAQGRRTLGRRSRPRVI
jgi:hypothetical protein